MYAESTDMNECSQPHGVSESSSLHTFKNNSLRLEIPTKSMSVMNPTSTPDYLLPASADGNESNLDHITCLERSLCSDFFCCGGRLPDFHALLEHFEEKHVMIVAPNGKRVYPRDGLRSVPQHKAHSVLTTPSPSSSRSSSVAPSSSSSTPPTPSDFISPTSGPFASRKSSLTALPPVYTPFTPGLPVDPADPYLDADEIVTQHDPRIYGYSDGIYPTTVLAQPVSTTSPSSSCDEDEEMSDSSAIDAPTSPTPPHVHATDHQPIAAIQKQVKFMPTRGRPPSKCFEIFAPLSKSKTKNRHSTSSSSTLSPSRRRAKSFRCPTPRCTKSYLNPNGLKYHMEKGTCKIEGEDDSGDGEQGDGLSSFSASAAVVSSTSDATNTNPRIHPHPAQDVEMIVETQNEPGPTATASDVSGTHYLNSTAPEPTTDMKLEVEEVPAAHDPPSSGCALRSVAELEVPSSDALQMLELQNQKSNSTYSPYYRSSSLSSVDICAVSTSGSASSSSSVPVSRPYSYDMPSASPKPKGNSKDKGKERKQKVLASRKPGSSSTMQSGEDADPQSRASTPMFVTTTPRPPQRQHQQHQQQQHTQQPVVYHYPVPSYPHLGGPTQGYHGYTSNTVHHRPYYVNVNDTAATVVPSPSQDQGQGQNQNQNHHPLLFSPIPVQLVGASNPARH